MYLVSFKSFLLKIYMKKIVSISSVILVSSRGCWFNLAFSYNFLCRFGHEKISGVIHTLLLIQQGNWSANVERMDM